MSNPLPRIRAVRPDLKECRVHKAETQLNLELSSASYLEGGASSLEE